jgi:hypothetical protein
LKGDLNSIWNLTEIGYGGAKPLNISVLNNQNGGIVDYDFKYICLTIKESNTL